MTLMDTMWGLREWASTLTHGAGATRWRVCGPCGACERAFTTLTALRDAARQEHEAQLRALKTTWEAKDATCEARVVQARREQAERDAKLMNERWNWGCEWMVAAIRQGEEKLIDTSGILRIGDKTKWGHVGGIACITGERYYFIVNLLGVVSMMPAIIVEQKK